MQIVYVDEHVRMKSYDAASEAVIDFVPDKLEVRVWLSESRSPDVVIQIADGDHFQCCCLDFTSSIHADGFDFTPYQPLDELDPDDKLGLQSDPFSKEPPF